MQKNGTNKHSHKAESADDYPMGNSVEAQRFFEEWERLRSMDAQAVLILTYVSSGFGTNERHLLVNGIGPDPMNQEENTIVCTELSATPNNGEIVGIPTTLLENNEVIESFQVVNIAEVNPNP